MNEQRGQLGKSPQEVLFVGLAPLVETPSTEVSFQSKVVSLLVCDNVEQQKGKAIETSYTKRDGCYGRRKESEEASEGVGSPPLRSFEGISA